MNKVLYPRVYFDENKDILILSEARNALFRIESLDRVIMYSGTVKSYAQN